jgi:hypothetical protein
MDAIIDEKYAILQDYGFHVPRDAAQCREMMRILLQGYHNWGGTSNRALVSLRMLTSFRGQKAFTDSHYGIIDEAVKNFKNRAEQRRGDLYELAISHTH